MYEAGGDQHLRAPQDDQDYEVGRDQRGPHAGRGDDQDSNLTDTDGNTTTSGNETTSPREKARGGIRRRRLQRRSTGKKIRDDVVNTFQVLMATSMMMAGWASELLGDPLWDAWAVTQSRHVIRESSPDSEIDCLEIFAGKARISESFAKRKRGVLQPRDLLYDHDLRHGDVQEELVEEIWKYRPGLIWLAPPCTAWCQFSHLNYTKQELRRKRKREEGLVRFVARLFELQNGLGGTVAVENPRGSDLWRHLLMNRLINFPTACFADLDMCQYQLTSAVDEQPLRKALSILTNNGVFADHIVKKCEPGQHEHRPIQGKDTAHSATYTTAFANAVVRAYDQAGRLPQAEHQQFPTSHREVEEKAPDKEGRGASGITFKGKVKPMVAATLKRIHQNLGHPPNREMIRHLRLSGASSSIIRAAEQMCCRTCERATRAKSARVAQPVAALDFNQVVAADILWIDTCQSKGWPALNIVDMASTYQVVLPLTSTTSQEVSRAFVDGWIAWAGAPRLILVDLDSAFKDQFLELMDQRSVVVRCAAGQAHWQNGLAERHGGVWKAIWDKMCEDLSIGDKDLREGAAAVSDAKNSLRNRSGYSPRQWVFGGQMRFSEDVFEEEENLGTLYDITHNEAFGRRHVIRMGARAAYFKAQTKEAIEKAIAHKTRVVERPFDPGELVYVFRETKGRKRWLGPCTVIGREGQNYWVARGGRCLLVAPEHVREAKHEEISEALRVKVAMRELKQLIEAEVDGSFYEIKSGDELDVGAPADLYPPDRQPQGNQEGELEVEREPSPMEVVEERAAALRAAARKAHVLDDVLVTIKRQRAHQPFYVKKILSEKGKEKQLDKELPWGMIPPDERPDYEEAELKQWQEHLQFEAVRPLSVGENLEVERTVSPDRILNCRFLYRDKNRAKRRLDPKIPVKAKARLCVAGQNDPDLGNVDMVTDAPTTSRHALLLSLQLSLARNWRASIGDIRAAFLNGIPAPRKLYFRQPKRGMPTLQKGQLIEIVKGVFGLSTSPKLWWMKLSGDLRNMEITYEDRKIHVVQNHIDPCVFMLVDGGSKTRGLLLTHVDDLILLTEPGLDKMVQEGLSRTFPVDEWEQDTFEYLGYEYTCNPECIKIQQQSYTQTRVEKVHIPSGHREDDLAEPEQIEENRTTIGCLSWLAKQTRPDLQFQVCQAQRRQRAPTIGDLKATNKIVQDAMNFKDDGLILRKIPEGNFVMLGYHDAAWGNVTPDDQRPEDEAWYGNQTLASQLAALVMVADKECLGNREGSFRVIDWKSRASQRVCRSTFAGETMACSEALEMSIYLRGLLLTLMYGQAVHGDNAGKIIPLHLITDCRGLFDHVHREGAPKAPSEKRLAIDLAGIRQALMVEAKHQWKAKHGDGTPTPEKPMRPPLHWLPTGEQLADLLTKRLKADVFWDVVRHGVLKLPFKQPMQGES